MLNCLHVDLEFAELIHRLGAKQIRGGNAVHCKRCFRNWEYLNPEDLPHWLFLRLQEENRLPMPALTPAIMKALKESVPPTTTEHD